MHEIRKEDRSNPIEVFVLKKGIVFSIEEFSVYDGPGIRTTVFLKGCPMRCMWCHSPEGQSFSPEMLRSPNGCIGCNRCIRVGEQKTGNPCLIPESQAVCPKNLIRSSGTVFDSEELTVKLIKNAFVLNGSGGGVTFSGGEPLAQSDFLIECLQRLEHIVNRAVQTCGFASEMVFRDVLKCCDYMLFDLKHMDPQKHFYYCGQDNTQILNNYRILAVSGKPFITRIPLIPTVNDTEQNIIATAKMLQELHVHEIEILPYHCLTGSKYTLAGRVYQPEFDEHTVPNPHLDIFEHYEIEVKIL